MRLSHSSINYFFKSPLVFERLSCKSLPKLFTRTAPGILGGLSVVKKQLHMGDPG